MKKNIKKILIANRGEIAIRVMKTCREMGIKTVAVYSDGDRHSLHVAFADEAYHLGADPASNSYLQQEKILEIAKKSGADSIHPGFGFLSENAGFAAKVASAGLVFVGPSPKCIESMGLKDRSKILAQEAGVPTIPGYNGEDQDPKTLEKKAREIGLPLLIKASAGGGGKGMVVVNDFNDFHRLLEKARTEAKNSFSNDHIILERYFTTSKHIEVQVFGDQFGKVVHLFERECSVQRRHQKIIEESPSPSLTPELREQICQSAVKLAKKVDYQNAGTVEFILDIATQQYFFLEMNTRLQVEHPVTEMVTGLDLVRLQIEVAMGMPLPFEQQGLRQTGHAVEVRLYAEDPKENFRPSPGEVYLFDASQNGARTDGGLKARDKISSFYDPMVAKIITHGKDRTEALKKMDTALGKTFFWGPPSNLYFLQHLVNHPLIVGNKFHTGSIEEHFTKWRPEVDFERGAAFWLITEFLRWKNFNVPVGFRNMPTKGSSDQFIFEDEKLAVTYKALGSKKYLINEKTYELITAELDGQGFWNLQVEVDGECLQAKVADRDVTGVVEKEIYVSIYGAGGACLQLVRRLSLNSAKAHEGDYRAPMPGKILKILVKKGEKVTKGQRLLTLEAMKIENEISAFKDGVIENIFVGLNEQVEMGKTLLHLSGE